MPASKAPAAVLLAVIWMAGASHAMAYGYAEAEDPTTAIFRDGASAARAGDFNKAGAKAGEGLALIKSHKRNGAGLAKKLPGILAAKDASATAELLANIVYLSAKEKLEANIDSGLKDYKESKTRLMLARKSYLDVLDGNLKKHSPEASRKIMESFDAAMAALGNPGLFGVGQKPADPEKFALATREIETAIEGFYARFDKQ